MLMSPNSQPFVVEPEEDDSIIGADDGVCWETSKRPAEPNFHNLL